MKKDPQQSGFRLRFRSERFGSFVRVSVRVGLVSYAVVTILLTLQVFGVFSLHLPGHKISETVLGNGSDPHIVRAGTPDPDQPAP